ncbi:MAG: hypothetical protein IKM02_07045 [Clostridia bacterium]|nr:hypothetical protein [Clostridia bacterium]
MFERFRSIKSLARWGAKPADRQLDEDILTDIARYWRKYSETLPEGRKVDDITWNDLDMDRVFQSMNHTMSITGSEVLYAMMRDTGCSSDVLKAREAMIDCFQTDEAARNDAQSAFRLIRSAHFHGAVEYIFSPEKRIPAHQWLYYMFGLLPLLCIILGFINVSFFAGLIPLMIVNIVVYYCSTLTWRAESCAVKHIASVLNCARRLVKLERPATDAHMQKMRSCLARLHGARFWCGLFALELPGELGIFTEYLRILFLVNMISLCSIIRHLRKNEQAVQDIYRLVGEMDACRGIASKRARCKGLTQPVFSENRSINAKELVHPLISAPVANDCLLIKNVLVTGSNASGKSTFIKAIAINAILAQTIHTCFASAFTMCRGRIMSSMAIRDDICSGESYFVAEIRSLKRILDAVDTGGMVFCFIDEILRGTNTVERIAASSSVLKNLESKNVICVAATHDVELTRILAGSFDNWHFREQITESSVIFDYRLCSGPATGRNAIALLERMGFETTVINCANDAVRHFEDTGLWKQS